MYKIFRSGTCSQAHSSFVISLHKRLSSNNQPVGTSRSVQETNVDLNVTWHMFVYFEIQSFDVVSILHYNDALLSLQNKTINCCIVHQILD